MQSVDTNGTVSYVTSIYHVLCLECKVHSLTPKNMSLSLQSNQTAITPASRTGYCTRHAHILCISTITPVQSPKPITFTKRCHWYGYLFAAKIKMHWQHYSTWWGWFLQWSRGMFTTMPAMLLTWDTTLQTIARQFSRLYPAFSHGVDKETVSSMQKQNWRKRLPSWEKTQMKGNYLINSGWLHLIVHRIPVLELLALL